VGGHGPSSIGLADPYIFQKKNKEILLACYFHLFFSAVFTCPIGRLRFVVVVHNHWARF
jgi:hypothetical protein